ncbi:ATP synthase gamma chain [Longimycelium tulufanense]|uniref:ATP synthase gamma chain n=1 Tax=Longimycelium tulufanense TaxID=907463 RepID=A0A8J3C9M7_9PSEU|nr:F0F1 ATP synthase subunit gamma [Longimycelium tulufanense]GGM35119.1 ATP synthase gamma chain [Longimycelium tulufanense]
MAAELRVLRQRIRSVQSTKKITRAMELIATSRIAKAQARVAASKPYADEITNVLSALVGKSTLDHPLLVEREQPRRAGVLVVTSDKGMCGGYNANVIRAAEELQALLREQGKEPVLYVIGRKGLGYYKFRQRALAGSWTGFSEIPHYVNASEAGDVLVQAFLAGTDDQGGHPGPDDVLGVDELHVVYTEFRSMLTQTPVAKRIAPLEIEYTEERPATLPPSYEFEPDAETLLTALLPKYIKTRLFAALLESAASESAARQRAMKAATDNANELIRTLTREANQARQAQITQEISEIVGGADALAAAGSEE